MHDRYKCKDKQGLGNTLWRRTEKQQKWLIQQQLVEQQRQTEGKNGYCLGYVMSEVSHGSERASKRVVPQPLHPPPLVSSSFPTVEMTSLWPGLGFGSDLGLGHWLGLGLGTGNRERSISWRSICCRRLKFAALRRYTFLFTFKFIATHSHSVASSFVDRPSPDKPVSNAQARPPQRCHLNCHQGTATPATSSRSPQSAYSHTLVEIPQLVGRLLSIIFLRKRQRRNNRCRQEIKRRDRDSDRKS